MAITKCRSIATDINLYILTKVMREILQTQQKNGAIMESDGIIFRENVIKNNKIVWRYKQNLC